MRLPVRYRPLGEPEWRAGSTANISGSGVLFRGDGSLDVDTPIEIAITLPRASPALRAPEVRCQAQIVRRAASAPAGVFMAAAFSEFEFAPRFLTD